MSIIVARDKPAMLNLVNKALNAIFRNPETPFLTAPVMDILFRGVVINCSVTDFAGKAVCTQLRTEAKDLEHVSDTIFKFSFFGMVIIQGFTILLVQNVILEKRHYR